MDGALAAWLDWLAAGGVRPRLAADLVREPDVFGPFPPRGGRRAAFRAGAGEAFDEHRAPHEGLRADHATASVVAALEQLDPGLTGQVVWDVGCGTGVLAAAAVRLGARHVVGTDLDPAALPLARATVATTGTALAAYAGPDVEGVPPFEPWPDVVVANLPHKPASCGPWVPLSQAGGEDGCAAHEALVRNLAHHLAQGSRIVFFLHSLPAPRLLARYADLGELTLLRWKLRWFGRGEYGPAAEGFRRRAAEGRSWLVRSSTGREGLVAGVWLVTKR